MKKIGIVGGLRPESTLYSYRTLIDLCRKREDLRGNYPEIIIHSLREQLSKFGLKVAEEKSQIIAFGRYPYYSARKGDRRLMTFDFLVKLNEWWEALRLKLIEYYRYYGISRNIAELKAFYKQAVTLAFKWLNRGSQKRSYNWTQFHRFLNFSPLPKPKIYHLIYTLSSQQGCITEEPWAGNLHAGFCEGH